MKFVIPLFVIGLLAGCASDTGSSVFFDQQFNKTNTPVICIVRDNAFTYGSKSVAFHDNHSFFGVLDRNEFACRSVSYGRHYITDNLSQVSLQLIVKEPTYYFIYFTTANDKWRPDYKRITDVEMRLLYPDLTEQKMLNQGQ